ncbi:ribosome biogenesis factor YjgA [Desulfovibrio intestinalis]|uniref:Ribosome-associated protein n=1 Tax=Desulfovibrio intestinalis TaxID=58621 RepID=A0A7W8C074_9BACT|nr:ribosome biogenesis factor YjgA [Desulfovibrio intestinalis]MBB5141984.1 ribosome-associated protein [Desulfovibrio intestinalis]
MPRKKQYQWHAKDENGDQDFSPPSRSAKKRESLALQAMGEELSRLSPQEVQALDLPPDLAEALALYARLRDHEGRRRQMQFIGRLMREADTAPIRAALDQRKETSAAATAALHRAEQWRERLLEAPEAELDDLLRSLPRPGATDSNAEADTDQTEEKPRQGKKAPSTDDLRKLVLQARKEVVDKASPHARRALFRALHSLLTA